MVAATQVQGFVQGLIHLNPSNHEDTPTQTSNLYPPVASPTSMPLEPAVVLCTASEASCLCHYQRPQGTRNQPAVGQLSLSSSAALAQHSLFSRSHSFSREMRSARPPSTSQADKSSLCPTLLTSTSLTSRAWLVASLSTPSARAALHSFATEDSVTRSACSGCARFRCCFPLLKHCMQLLHSFHP